jgi:methylphosphotriester-DNA--protein-cysteine methyltransferase
MKRFAFMCLLAMLPSCNGGSARTVVVVEKTKSYHRRTCPKLNMAQASAMGMEGAMARHLKPCPYCKPDRTL